MPFSCVTDAQVQDYLCSLFLQRSGPCSWITKRSLFVDCGAVHTSFPKSDAKLQKKIEICITRMDKSNVQSRRNVAQSENFRIDNTKNRSKTTKI